MRLLEAAPGGPWLLQAPAAAEEWRGVRQDRRLREADFLLRSRADRRGECSIMTIPGEPAGRIQGRRRSKRRIAAHSITVEQCGGRNSDSMRRWRACLVCSHNLGGRTTRISSRRSGDGDDGNRNAERPGSTSLATYPGAPTFVSSTRRKGISSTYDPYCKRDWKATSPSSGLSPIP